MATRKLSEQDEKFIQNLADNKGSFFFKEKPKRKKTRGGRNNILRGFGFGVSASKHFVGFYINARGSVYKFGYSRN